MLLHCATPLSPLSVLGQASVKCTYVRSRSREKTKKKQQEKKKQQWRRWRLKRGHSTATKRLACHPVLGQSVARQVLSKQLSSSSSSTSSSRCHKCSNLATRCRCRQSNSNHTPCPPCLPFSGSCRKVFKREGKWQTLPFSSPTRALCEQRERESERKGALRKHTDNFTAI